MKQAKDSNRFRAAHTNRTTNWARLRHGVSQSTASLALALGLASQAVASTFVCGNVSGTWTKTGSPYIATCNLTVPAGQSLTIQPGVTFIIGQGLRVDVLGSISAVGTAAERITIRGANSSLYWDTIFIRYTGPEPTRFLNCNISDATNAISLKIYEVTATMTAQIDNCIFANCASSAVFGDSQGSAYFDNWCAEYVYDPTLDVALRNCRFVNFNTGCRFLVHGGARYEGGCGGTVIGTGRAMVTIENGVFQSVAGRAVSLEAGDYSRSSIATFVNNVFIGGSNAMVKADGSGVWSDEISYNCFYGNSTNFVGYPPVYGVICCVNNNGTPCDVANNIFTNPLFVETNTYTLANNSPCIDAGNPAGTYQDLCFPPSKGTPVNDIGIWGGPYACGSPAPMITRQPEGKTSCLGGAATFSIGVSGPSPLAYQWYHGTTLLSGQTGTNLSLTNLQSSDAGTYQVVVTNAFGRVTSAPASLVVNDACVDICMYAGLNIAGLPGRTYELRYTTDLNNTNFATWTFLATNTTPWFYIDTTSCGVPKRFYGVKLLP